MKRIKLLSDFDGIWTNQDEEADYVLDCIVSKLSNITNSSVNEILELLVSIKSEMDKAPYNYGWRNNGEISSYYKEDRLSDNNAVFDFIERNHNKNIPLWSLSRRGRRRGARNEVKNIPPLWRRVRDEILNAGYESLDTFSNSCFFESTSKFKEEGKLKPVFNAKEVLTKLLESDVNVVVASNSKTDKIEYLFSKLGHIPANENSSSKGQLYARGNSMKFVIENDYTEVPRYLNINENYRAALRRKFYHKVLLDERPDFVIGDIFSLDLALPLYLRLHDINFRKLKVVLKLHKHTPDWVKRFLSKEEFKGIAFMIEDLEELLLIANS